MDETVPGAPPDSLVERIKRSDAADQEIRRALATVAGLIQHLPDTEDLLLAEQTRRALRVLRDRCPELYLANRAAIRQRCGRHVVDILDAYIGPPAQEPWRELQVLTIPELMAQPATEWRIAKLLPNQGLAVVYGKAGSGKSFLAFHMSCAIARGARFFGRETKPGLALYLCMEGRSRDRADAYLRCYDLQAADLNVRFIEQAIDLCGPTLDLERLEAIARELRPAIVVIDTLARATGGGDENSAADMGRLVASFKRLEEASSGLILVVHHSGKDSARGARGHSSLRAAADCEIEVARNGDEMRTARLTKARDAEDGVELHFRLDVIELGDGRSSCVVLPAGDSHKPKRAERELTADPKLCLEALREQIEQFGEKLPETSVIPGGRRGCKVDAWRDRFYSRIGEERNPSARRTAFHRAKNALLAKKLVGCWKDWAWLI